MILTNVDSLENYLVKLVQHLHEVDGSLHILTDKVITTILIRPLDASP